MTRRIESRTGNVRITLRRDGLSSRRSVMRTLLALLLALAALAGTSRGATIVDFSDLSLAEFLFEPLQRLGRLHQRRRVLQ